MNIKWPCTGFQAQKNGEDGRGGQGGSARGCDGTQLRCQHSHTVKLCLRHLKRRKKSCSFINLKKRGFFVSLKPSKQTARSAQLLELGRGTVRRAALGRGTTVKWASNLLGRRISSEWWRSRAGLEGEGRTHHDSHLERWCGAWQAS